MTILPIQPRFNGIYKLTKCAVGQIINSPQKVIDVEGPYVITMPDGEVIQGTQWNGYSFRQFLPVVSAITKLIMAPHPHFIGASPIHPQVWPDDVDIYILRDDKKQDDHRTQELQNDKADFKAHFDLMLEEHQKQTGKPVLTDCETQNIFRQALAEYVQQGVPFCTHVFVYQDPTGVVLKFCPYNREDLTFAYAFDHSTGVAS